MGVLLLSAAVAPSWAQVGGANGVGIVQAVSYREVPNQFPLTVTLFDDSNLDLRIRDQMLSSLKRSAAPGQYAQAGPAASSPMAPALAAYRRIRKTLGSR